MRYSTFKKIVGCLMLSIIVAFMLAASMTAPSAKATKATTVSIVITSSHGKLSPLDPPPAPPPPHLRMATMAMNARIDAKMNVNANGPMWQCSGSGVYRVCNMYYSDGRVYTCKQRYDSYNRQYYWECYWWRRY
jgi:ABC-type transport system substrate-binding protein